MNVAWRRTMTLEDFLIWEAEQPETHEFDGVQPIAMAGCTEAHDVIRANLSGELFVRLRGKSCRVQRPDLKIVVAGRARYPDAFVVCSPIVNTATFLTEPVVVFEVMS